MQPVQRRGGEFCFNALLAEMVRREIANLDDGGSSPSQCSILSGIKKPTDFQKE